MAAKDIRFPPKSAPGKGVQDALAAGLYRATSDTFGIGDTLPALLFNVPSGTLIYDLILSVTTAITDASNSGTLIAGIDADSDMFFSDTTQCGAGTYSMHGAGALNSGVYIATGDVVVECSWATTNSAGGGVAYLIYADMDDPNYVNL